MAFAILVAESRGEIQQSLLEAHCNAEPLARMSQPAFFPWLRNALNHNVLDAVKNLKAQKNDVRRRVRAADLEASFIRLEQILIANETSPSEVVQRNG